MTKLTKPMACSLTDKEFRFRRKAARKELLPHLKEVRKTTEGLVLRFHKAPAIQSIINKFIELELQCCSFLTLDTINREDCIEVSIAAGPEGTEAVHAIFKSITPHKGILRGGYTGIAVGGLILMLCCIPLILGAIGLTVLSTTMLAFGPPIWVEVIGIIAVFLAIIMVYIAAKKRSQKDPSICC